MAASIGEQDSSTTYHKNIKLLMPEQFKIKLKGYLAEMDIWDSYD